MSQDDDANEGTRAKKKRLTRTAIHRAALQLLCAGEGEVTVDKIAAEAGISPRTFFNYFPTKESAFTGVDPKLSERLAAEVLARPSHENTMQAVRHVIIRRLQDLFCDAELWRLRRAAAERFPGVLASMMGANAVAEHAMVLAACQRVKADIRVDVSPAAEALMVLGAARAVMMQHMELELQGSLDDRMTMALRSLGAALHHR